MTVYGIPLLWVVIAAAMVVITVAPEAVAGALSGVCRMLGLLVHLPAWGLEQLSAKCERALHATLRWEESQLGLAGNAALLMVISRLLYGLLAADIVISTTYLDLKSIGPILFGADSGSVNLPLPLSVPLAAGMLTFAVVALFGMLLLESLHVVPLSVHLYPNPTPGAKRLMGWVAGVGSFLCLVMVTAIFVARQIIAEGLQWPAAALLVSALQGLLSNVASVIAFWALVLGLVAVISVVLAVTWMLSLALHYPFTGIAKALDWLADEVIPHLINALSAPGRWLWNTLVNLPVIRAMRLPRLRRAQAASALAKRERSGVEESQEEPELGDQLENWPKVARASVAQRGEEEEMPVVNGKLVRPMTSLLFIDTFGHEVIEPLLGAVHRLGGSGGVRLAGYVPLERMPDGPITPLTNALKARDVSIRPWEVEQARRSQSAVAPYEERLLDTTRFKVQTASAADHAGQDLILVFLDVRRLKVCAGALTELHRNLRRQSVTLVLQIPALGLSDEEVQTGLNKSLELRQAGVIQTAIVVEERSPLMRRRGAKVQARYLSETFAQLITMERHYDGNKTFSEQLTLIGSRFPFVGLAVGSGSLVMGNRLSIFDPGRHFARERAGRGNAEQIGEQIKLVTEEVLSDPATCMVDVPFDPSRRPVLYTCRIPLGAKDNRFSEVVEDAQVALHGVIPGAVTSFIHANGVSDGTIGAHFFTSLACLYGIRRDELGSEAALWDQGEQTVHEQWGPRMVEIEPDDEGIAAKAAAKPARRSRKTALRIVSAR